MKRLAAGDIVLKAVGLLLFYHHDYPDCRRAIPQYEQMARDLAGNEDFLRIALVAIPPYGRWPVSQNSACSFGQLSTVKEWFVTTPTVLVLRQRIVEVAWEGKAPTNRNVIGFVAQHHKPGLYDKVTSENSDDLDSGTPPRNQARRRDTDH